MLHRVAWGQYNPDTLYKRMLRLAGQRITVVTAGNTFSGQLLEVLPDHIRMQNELVPAAEVFIPLRQIVTVFEPVLNAQYAARQMAPAVCGWQYFGRRLFGLTGQRVGFELAGVADQGRITCGRILDVACDYVLIEGGVFDNITYNAVIPLNKIQSVQVGVCPEPGAPIPAQVLRKTKAR